MVAQAPIRIIEITDDRGAFVAPEWLARALAIHAQLRQLPAEVAGYRGKLERVIAGGGRLCIAARGEQVQGVAVWRMFENTHDNLKLYVDDLVTDEARRSTGVGRALIAHSKPRRARSAATSTRWTPAPSVTARTGFIFAKALPSLHILFVRC